LGRRAGKGLTEAREIGLLPNVRVVLAPGAIAWRAYLDHLRRGGMAVPRPSPRFGHGALADGALLGGRGPRKRGLPVLLGSYHVSQENTQTGKLTPAMFDAILRKALEKAAL
jgi:uracil-DNA glycosylase